jgi:hypothetical protein
LLSTEQARAAIALFPLEDSDSCQSWAGTTAWLFAPEVPAALLGIFGLSFCIYLGWNLYQIRVHTHTSAWPPALRESPLVIVTAFHGRVNHALTKATAVVLAAGGAYQIWRLYAGGARVTFNDAFGYFASLIPNAFALWTFCEDTENYQALEAIVLGAPLDAFRPSGWRRSPVRGKFRRGPRNEPSWRVPLFRSFYLFFTKTVL